MESKEKVLELVSKTESERCRYLSDLFKYMPEAISKELIYMEVKKGDYLLTAGSPCDTVYILLKGQVVGIDHQKLGRIYSFMDFTKMYVIGDFEIFADCKEYSVSICAQEDCKVFKIQAKRYLRWIKNDGNAMFLRMNNILKSMVMEKKIDREYLFMGCKERLINYLIRLYEKESDIQCGKIKVEMTQAQIADKIGFNLRSVQRNIASLEEEGTITNKHGKMQISHEQYELLKAYDIKRKKD